ncbi:MAG: hypothetical protein QNJ94_16915 [Alphaproteobacteria bacterium]|nr:hypothetical protein [Alphaproteobacteria bacterium]
MEDDSNLLERIAVAVESLSSPNVSLVDLGQLLYIAVGGALGAVLTYVVRKKHQAEVDRRHKAKEEEELQEKKLLLSGLLGDEIVLRWKEQIASDLGRHFRKFSLEDVSTINRTHLSDNDLYVFKQCGLNMFEADVFEDKTLVSHIVYVHMLIKDFLDGKEALAQIHQQYLSSTRDSPTKTTESDVRQEWKRLASQFDQLDGEIDKVFRAIESEYRKYISDSRFARLLSEDLPAEFQRIYARYAEARRTGDTKNIQSV